MSLFGSSPKRPPRPDAEASLFDQAQQQRGTAASMAPLMRLRLADIADPSNEIRQQRGLANADTAQGMGRLSDGPITRNTAFDRAMTRGRGLTRVAMMGEQAARMQGVRDRASVASFGQALQRGQSSSLAGLAQSQAITDASRMQVQQVATASRANVLGTIAGGLSASPFQDKFQGWALGSKAVGGTGTGMGTYRPVNGLADIPGLVMRG